MAGRSRKNRQALRAAEGRVFNGVSREDAVAQSGLGLTMFTYAEQVVRSGHRGLYDAVADEKVSLTTAASIASGWPKWERYDSMDSAVEAAIGGEKCSTKHSGERIIVAARKFNEFNDGLSREDYATREGIRPGTFISALTLLSQMPQIVPHIESGELSVGKAYSRYRSRLVGSRKRKRGKPRYKIPATKADAFSAIREHAEAISDVMEGSTSAYSCHYFRLRESTSALMDALDLFGKEA